MQALSHPATEPVFLCENSVNCITDGRQYVWRK